MEPKTIFRKTLPFVWAKLLLWIVTLLVSGVLLAILLGIGLLFKSEGVTGIMIVIWLAALGVIRLVIMHYFGYLVKAGHVAVIAEAVTTGRVPDNQVAYGKALVKERFATASVYFAVDKLVSGSVKQIQKVVEKAGNALDFIPGMGAVVGAANFFIEIFLGYIDECCLGYTFYRREQGAFKSAADGVVIYAQNWKSLLKNAAKTVLFVLLGLVGILLVCFIVLGLLFRALNWSGFVAFLISLVIAWAVKSAFLDSYVLVRVMSAYMTVAPTTQITFDLYGKLSGVSGKFKDLFNKGQQEQPTAPTAAYAAPAQGVAAPTVGAPAPAAPQSAGKPIFCGQCGAKNDAGTRFCGSCGAKLM